MVNAALLVLVLAAAAASLRPAAAHTSFPRRMAAGVPPGGGVPQPHLADLFSTVAAEADNVTAPVVKGAIPAWLHFTKYNNGFGQYEGDGFELKYLFDVMAYVVKWRVDGDAVTFSNKLIRSEYLAKAGAGIPEYRTFGGTTPPLTGMAKIKTLTHMTSDNLNVNVVKFGERLFAISDMSGAMELDPLTLDTVGMLKWNDTIGGTFSMITCAHPNQLDGDPYAYNYYADLFGNVLKPGGINAYKLFRIDTSRGGGTLAREVMVELPLPLKRTPYMHSFAQTTNYIIFFKFPLMWDLLKIVASIDILPAMTWTPNNGTHVIVIDKRTWQVAAQHWTAPFFAYHHINAFETPEGDVACDITTVPCTGAEGLPANCLHMNTFNLATLRNDSWAIPNNVVRRYTVPVKSQGKITHAQITPMSFDLPMLNDKFRGKPYRWVFATGDHEATPGVWYNSLVKVDMHTGATTEWFKPDHYPSEPNFMPRPASEGGTGAEDDGVIVSTILCGPEGTSFLLVLNATTWEEIAWAKAPHFLPYMSHGFAEQDPF